MGSQLTGVNMKRIVGIIAALFLLAAAPARAGMISSDAAIPQPPSDRERVEAVLARPEVQKELEKHGLAPADAAARVQALSDREVAQLAGRLDSLPAGAAITNDELLLIIIIILLVALLL
jgi:hypothetical protein